MLLISQEDVSLVIPAKTQAQPVVQMWRGKRDLSTTCLLNDEVAEHSPAEKTCIVWVIKSHGNLRTLNDIF